MEGLRYILFATFHIHPCIRKRLHSCQTVMKHSAYLFPLWCKELHWLHSPHHHPNIPSCSFHLNRCLRKRKLIDYTPFSSKERRYVYIKLLYDKYAPRLQILWSLSTLLFWETLYENIKMLQSRSYMFISAQSSLISYKGGGGER